MITRLTAVSSQQMGVRLTYTAIQVRGLHIFSVWGIANCPNAVDEMRREGKKVSLCHFNYINPLPKGVRDIFAKFRRIVVCELNEGQFAAYLRQNFQEFPYEQYNKCEGLPFTVAELKQKFESLLK